MTYLIKTYLPQLEGAWLLQWLVYFSGLTLRYLVFAGAAYLLFYVWKKRAWFYKKIQQKYPEQKRVLYDLRYSFSSFAIFATLALLVSMATKAGYTKIYTDFSAYGWGYFLLSTAAFILIHDMYFYWTHRLMHHPKLFKHVHKVHHMSHNPTPWAAFSFHPLEALVEFGILPVMVFLMPMHPAAILIFSIYMVTLNVLGHLGFEIFPKGFTQHKLFGLHNTSTHHNMHHKYVNCNYGLYFNIWDRLMGTNHAKYHSTFDNVAGRPKPVTEQREENTSLAGLGEEKLGGAKA